MTMKFYHIVLIFTVLIAAFIYVLHLLGLVTAANEVYARFFALGIFIVSVFILGIGKAKHHHFSKSDFYKNNTLIIISLTLLLCSLFIFEKISYYFIGFFAFAVLLRAINAKKFYPPPKFVYFIILYALLMLFGTISTQNGFRFPDSIVSFFVLPAAFCCFQLSRKNLLAIAEIFFKTGVIFLIISILYWWFNFLHLNANFLEWITEKTSYTPQMLGWNKQANIWLSYLYNNVSDLHNVKYFNAYFFITSWSYHFHPTANAIVIIGAMISGFYLLYKKNEFPSISKWDLTLFIAFCLLAFLLMQSRIAVVGFFVVLSVWSFYFFKLKTKYFNIFLVIYVLFIAASLIVFNQKVTNFLHDDVRSAYRTIGISYIKEHLLWGGGFNEQQLVLEQQAEKIKDTLPDSVYPHSNHPIFHVHNQFLGDMVQFGIWGLIALVAMLTSIAYYAIKNRNYLLQSFLCFIFCFMLIEEGEFIAIFIFIMFFTALDEIRTIKN